MSSIELGRDHLLPINPDYFKVHTVFAEVLYFCRAAEYRWGINEKKEGSSLIMEPS
jgi:hypothetical protein